MVYNINEGKNRDILNKCRWLGESMDFVNKVRECHYGKSDDDLLLDIETAIDYCVEHDILKEFLKTHRNEVVKNIQLDYTFDRQLELERADAREEGWQEGREEGWQEGLEKGNEEGIKKGIEQGIEKGIEQGRVQERKLLVDVVMRLRNGDSPEQLISEGIDSNTIELAKTIL